MTIERVGFIGLGDQGAPMAEMIIRKGFALDVWARRPESSAPLAKLGADLCATVADLGVRCDVVGVCVVDDDGVVEIAVDHGLLDSMRRGGVLLIHSTISPATCQELARVGEKRGVAVLDAPVSGGRAGALAGKLSVIVGGDADAFDMVRPVLEAYGDPIRHVGESGAGQAVKLVNNGLFVANVAMAHAAVALGERLGVDPAVLTEVLVASSGRSVGLEALAPLVGTDWGRHAWSVLRKDVELLEHLQSSADGDGAPLARVASAAVQRFSTG